MKIAVLLVTLLFSFTAQSAIKTVDIAGYSIEYEVIGNGKEVVLLEAGGGGGLADWDEIPAALSKSATVIRYSRVGNGNSSKPETLFVVEDYANHLKALLDHIGIERIIHVAHSYGGSVASVKRYEEPEHLFHSDKGREMWGSFGRSGQKLFHKEKSFLLPKAII